MKPPLSTRLEVLPAGSPHRREKGVAVVAVLGILALMAGLTVALLRMSADARARGAATVEILRAESLRETAITLALAQLIDANSLISEPVTNSNDVLTWTTQPGAVRTYSATDPSRTRLYKLYSSKVPVLRNLQPGKTAELLANINEDMAGDWTDRPDEFVDLNEPVFAHDVWQYPIADARMWSGLEADALTNVEGFRYSANSLNKQIAGVDTANARLPMPVRWIYQLEDGTLGWLDDGWTFTPLNPDATGAITRDNPIVGRMAWWADDESCKVNLNTASVPAIWDTPRTTSREDVWLANTQPLAGEYQRYPGHPATVDLSAVFFPGRRFTGTDGSWTMPIGASMKSALTSAEANLIWDLTPYIVGSQTSVYYGTNGGQIATALRATAGFDFDAHLFTSVDEAYFLSTQSWGESLNTGRRNLLDEKLDPHGAFLQRLERSRFFLTVKSNSPESTNQGYPRISMFPVDARASVPVLNPVTSSSGVSPYDITLTLSCSLGGKPYFWQRRDLSSRHDEFFNTSETLSSGRNAELFKYLKELSKFSLAGYALGFPGTTPMEIPNPFDGDESGGPGFSSKYPAGLNPVTGQRYADSGHTPRNGRTLGDATDRTQILLSMMDFSRCINMQPGFITNPGDRYDNGNGQAAGVCLCGIDWAHDHGDALLASNTSYRVPKAPGKVMAPSEIGFVINVAGKKTGTDAALGDWNRLAGQLGPLSKQVAEDNTIQGTRYIVEVGIAMGCFNPKIGWAPTQGRGGAVISGSNSSAENPISPALSQLPILCNLDGKRMETLTVCAAISYSSGVNSGTGTPRKIAKGLIPYGGMQGPRAMLTATPEANGFAICSPICIVVPGENDAQITPAFQVDPHGVIRILPLDGEFAQQNVVNVVELSLPRDFLNGIQATYTGLSLRIRADRYSPLVNGGVGFPAADNAVRSFVIPHGDYRLATSLKMDSDLFVAHQSYTGRMAHSFYEANSSPGHRKLFGATYSNIGIIDTREVPKFLLANRSPMVSALPLPAADPVDMQLKRTLLYTLGGPDPDVEKYASRDPDRARVFRFGRRDGNGQLAKRGSSDPDETGDFDNGPGAAEDGPYMNHADEGDRRAGGGIPYFTNLTQSLRSLDSVPAARISPNFIVRSPVDFGSIPSGLQARVPWQTLRFRPDPGMNDPAKTMKTMADNPPAGLPFANFCGPRDHFFLDMFWMPVVEPWAISLPGSTQGTINLNQQIFPFLHIQRTTALHALLRGERMLAIPNAAADKYKKADPITGAPDNPDDTYRHFINAGETVKQFQKRYAEGKDPEGFPLAFNTFRSASEICETWLVPDKNRNAYDGDKTWDLAWIIGKTDTTTREGFWADHRLTGDNSRERPYSNLYPRVTVRSNVFQLHLIAQTLESPRLVRAGTSAGQRFTVTAQWRGSCILERALDPTGTRLNSFDFTNLRAAAPATVPSRLDSFHTFSVSNVREFAP